MMSSISLTDIDSYSDTVSEGTTISRSSSLERLRLPEGHVREKFRVDRRKLEAMILRFPPDPWDIEVMNIPISSDGKVMSIDEFFQKIMQATNTEIKYPKYLDVSAKNKKDPHVHIMGLPQNVMEASQMVRNELQPQCKVTLKMDVEWTHHSHIIGKGGNNIQAVVKQTGVSIHFPDGNKNSDTHKCNQVSINSRGKDLTSLEEARCAVREQTPLIFSFMLPAAAEFIILTVNAEALVHSVQSTYNVQVELKLIEDDPPFIFGQVKGIQWDACRVKEATLRVLNALCGSVGYQMQVHMTLHVSVQHHAFVLGHNNENIRSIMQSTATTIKFPDPNDSFIHSLDKSKLIISGGVEGVYLAHQNLVGCLPLVLMFDLPSEQVLDTSEINHVMQSLDVFILARKKHVDGRKSIIIKGPERNASSIYQAWKQLSKTSKISPKAKVPPGYFMSQEYTKNLYGYGGLPEPLVPQPTVSPNPDCYPYENMMQNFVPYGNPSSSGGSSNCFAEDELIKLKEIMESMPDRRAPGYEKSLKTAAQELYSKKVQAIKAMKEPITDDPRVPNSKWSGQGFSKSMPGYMIQEMHMAQLEQNLNNQRTSGWNAWASSQSHSTSAESSSGSQDMKREWSAARPSASSYMDTIARNSFNLPNDAPPDISTLLTNLHLAQYIDIFSAHDIDMKVFLTLTEDELKDIGITLFGHRKKILLAIKYLTTNASGLNPSVSVPKWSY